MILLKIGWMVITSTLFFSLPVPSNAHPEINYTQSFVKFHNGYHMHLEEPEKPKDCDVIGNCLILPLILVIVVIMVIVIYHVRKEDSL
jgi:hypothetical protein